MRRSSRMSPSVITCLPTVTATRSRISACAAVTRSAMRRVRIISRFASLIGLTQGKVKLKQVDLLRRQHSLIHDQLLVGAGEPVEARRVGAEAKVGADWTDRRAISDSET